jgi:starch synthase
MQCQRYGCIPIVRKTGGLADTVRDIEHNPATGNGVTFNTMTTAALMRAVRRAIEIFKHPDAIAKIIDNSLRERNDWSHRMDAYKGVYGY